MASHITSSLTYNGERISDVAGAPCLSRFFPANPDRPLIVLIPGGAHNARIFYGGHEGFNPDDFLTTWLNRSGYGALAISYPFESEHQILPATAPNFRIDSWGRQAAQVTKHTVDEHDLCGDVVLVGWSMGGRMLGPYARTATGLGLTFKLFVSLAATPGLPGARPGPPETKLTQAGYATLADMLGYFMLQVHDQELENGGKTIIPERIYATDYFGATPVGLLGWGVESYDEWAYVKDAAVHPVSDLPWMANLIPTSRLDGRHVLTDRATWTYLMTLKLTQIVQDVFRQPQLDPEHWRRIVDFVHSTPMKLSASVRGNHFFFLGRSGAEATAAGIFKMLEESESLRVALDRLLKSS